MTLFNKNWKNHGQHFLSSDTIKGTKKNIPKVTKQRGKTVRTFPRDLSATIFPLLFCFSYFYIRRFTSCYLLSDSVNDLTGFSFLNYAAAYEDGYKGSQWQYWRKRRLEAQAICDFRKSEACKARIPNHKYCHIPNADGTLPFAVTVEEDGDQTHDST